MLNQEVDAQKDLYDYNNSKAFAENLYNNGEYGFAKSEFQRVIYLMPNDSSLLASLLACYRNLGEYSEGLDKIEKYISVKEMPTNICKEYIRTAFAGSDTSAFRRALGNDNLSIKQREFYEFLALLNIRAYKTMDIKYADLINTPEGDLENRMSSLYISSKEIKRKSIGLGVAMSVVVPGLGKVYSGYWKDGLMSFIYTTVAGWQAYRGFKKKGISSAYGWIYSGVATGFYLGNIYGTVKWIKRKNSERQQKIKDEILNSIVSF
ncbi:MAG: hypothetical protein HRT72_04955 [Flavobacteriales bacterium]|nr:hypothetical protein [Flavobacteriales bacterium]